MRRSALIGAVLFSGLAVGTAEARFLAGAAGTLGPGVVVGDGLILFSPGPNSHHGWSPAAGTDSGLLYTAVVATNDGSFVAVADDGSAWRSTNATASAFVRRTGAAAVALRAVAQLGAQLVAVGDAGAIVRSSDLAAGSWVPIASPTSRNLYGIATNSLSTSVAVGESGTILRGNLQGTEWQFLQLQEDETFRAVVAAPSGRFLAVGDRGAMWIGEPNGTDWTSASGDLTTSFTAATQVGNATVVVGKDRTAYYASNNFTGWQLTTTPADTDYDLYAVAYTGPDVIAAGTGRTVLRSLFGVDWELLQVTPVVETSWGRVKAQFRETPAAPVER